MFTLTGHRTPTIQHLELGADADGRLTAAAHDVIEHTATQTEFAEQTAACGCSGCSPPVASSTLSSRGLSSSAA
jgi:CO/xanthine dehydrogenase Mo-binding subunit